MNTYELMECLREMSKGHKMQFDVLPMNRLEGFQIEHYPLSLIVNCDPSDMPGSHWTLLFQQSQYAELEGFCRYVVFNYY